jgi:hypothetical protein
MEFKVIIAGGRDFHSFPILRIHMDHLLKEKAKTCKITIISGGARGADTLGEKYAQLRHYKVIKMKADWKKHRRSAGFVRNKDMLDLASGVVCFWNKRSKGTKHMIDITAKANKPLRIINY